ncbi:MAG: hypothetical protein AB4426_14190 [Xenococcaceae cyanobacterium]
MPDGRSDEQVLVEDIAPEIQRRDDLPFVIHLGDLGRPQDACSDAWLEKSKAFWENELLKPVFYTPGDNDWTDCDRQNLPMPTSELERLEAVRRIFFSQPKTLSVEWRYETQSSLPENAIWWHEGILFVTQHIVSTDNGRTDIQLDDPKQAIALVDERDKGNQLWLSHAFEMAKKSDTAAVVVATQLDPFGAPKGEENAFARCMNNPAYKGFCSHLQMLASTLDKPVLLVHGDTNAYCLDQPFSLEQAPKLWRLNAPGDFKVIDASVVSFNPANSDQPFEATGLLSGTAAPQECDYSR